MKQRIIIFLLYGLSSLAFLIYFRNHLTAPDTVNYLFLAEYIIQGDWSRVVNGHWGILMPLLLSPWLALGIEPFLAFKLLNWMVSFFTLYIFHQFLRRHEIQVWLDWAFSLLAFPLLFMMALMTTADLLLITLAMYYLYTVSQPDFFKKPVYVWKAGILGGLMFLSKSYGLPFFIAHFGLIHLFAMVKKEGRPASILISFGKGLAGFFMVAVIWIILLSARDSHFSIGTSGKYNMALIGPERNGLQITKDELIPPHTDVSHWWAYQEPAFFVNSWNPFASKKDFLHYKRQIIVNIKSTYYIPFIRDMVIVLILLFIAIKIWKVQIPSADRLFLKYGSLAIILYTIGYWFIIVRPRYLWLDFLLLMLMTVVLLKNLSQTKHRQLTYSISVFVMVIMSINTVVSLLERTKDHRFLSQVVEIEKTINDDLLRGKNIAIIDIPYQRQLMEADVYLLYKKRFFFYGQPFESTLMTKGKVWLEENDIDYFMLWGNNDQVKSIFNGASPVFTDEKTGLSIYSVKG